jgi:uncharacterized membrane protein
MLAKLARLLANELFLAMACGALLAVSLIRPGLGVLRVAAGMVSVLFVPGYALVGAAAPRRDEIDDVSRIGLAFGLSVAGDAILAWALSLTPMGITLESAGCALAGWSLAFALIANVRRMWTRHAAHLESPTPFQWRKVLLFGSGLALIAGLGAMAAMAYTSPTFTAFYLLGPDGSLDSLPQEVTNGQRVQVTIGIINHERTTQTYWYEVRYRSQQLARGQEVTLDSLEQDERSLTFTLDVPPDDEPVTLEFYLYQSGDMRPIRSLRWPVWVVSTNEDE